MTRIETQPENDRDALKKEIVSELRGEERRRKAIGCGACALFYVALFVGVGWWVGSTLTKTGFVRVPYIAASTYVPAEPVRTVAPLSGTDPEDVPAIVGARAKFNAATGTLTVPMKEADLTTVMAAPLMSGAAGLPFKVERAQIAIEPEFIELFLVSPQDGRKATVGVRFTPSVVDGRVSLELRQIEVGRIVLPDFLGNILFTAVKTAFEDAIATASAKAGELRDITLSRGQIDLVFATPRK